MKKSSIAWFVMFICIYGMGWMGASYSLTLSLLYSIPLMFGGAIAEFMCHKYVIEEHNAKAMKKVTL